MTDRELMGQALDVLEDIFGKNKIDVGVINRLRDRLAQPEQEPVAWMYVNTDGECEQIEYSENDPMPDDPSVTPLYTTPRQWKGLTDAEIKAPIQRAMQHFGFDPTQYSLGGMATIGFLGLVKEIEAKLREKNT